MKVVHALLLLACVSAFQPQQLLPLRCRARQQRRQLSLAATDTKELLEAMDQGRIKGLDEIQRYRGKVDKGYGRGGKMLGFPTANLPASLFQDALQNVATGVYLGWVGFDGTGLVYKSVVNVGYSPTFEEQQNKEKIIEAHLILDEGEDMGDFYGVTIRLQLIGFLRDEQKFDSFDALIAQIKDDVEDAKNALDVTPYKEMSGDAFFTAEGWSGSSGDSTASWQFSPMEEALEAVFGESSESKVPAPIESLSIDELMERDETTSKEDGS